LFLSLFSFCRAARTAARLAPDRFARRGR